MHFGLTVSGYIINPKRKGTPSEKQTPQGFWFLEKLPWHGEGRPHHVISSHLIHWWRCLGPFPSQVLVLLSEQSLTMQGINVKGLRGQRVSLDLFCTLWKYLSPQLQRPTHTHTHTPHALMPGLPGKSGKADRCLSYAPRKQAGERATSCVYGEEGEHKSTTGTEIKITAVQEVLPKRRLCSPVLIAWEPGAETYAEDTAMPRALGSRGEPAPSWLSLCL